jgi:hypothetical protein
MGCCSGCWWVGLVIFVVLLPAAAFPWPLAVLAYLIEAAMVATWMLSRCAPSTP